jgi:hypothetical protein
MLFKGNIHASPGFIWMTWQTKKKHSERDGRGPTEPNKKERIDTRVRRR